MLEIFLIWMVGAFITHMLIFGSQFSGYFLYLVFLWPLFLVDMLLKWIESHFKQ